MLELGQELHKLRKQNGATLQTISSGAKISAAYLQKLENGKVNAPSPHVLRRLAEVLEVPYLRLMALAGYLPEQLELSVPAALRHQELSDEQWQAVVAFINYLKDESSS